MKTSTIMLDAALAGLVLSLGFPSVLLGAKPFEPAPPIGRPRPPVLPGPPFKPGPPILPGPPVIRPVSPVKTITLPAGQAPTKSMRGMVFSPTKIDDSKKLKEIFPAKKTQTFIANQVDFNTNYVLYFLWKGAPDDQINRRVTNNKLGDQVLQLNFSPGKEAELADKYQLLVVPKKMKFYFANLVNGQ